MREKIPVERLDSIDSGWFRHSLVEPSFDVFDNVVFKDKRDLREEDLAKYDIVIDLAAVSNDPMGSSFETATMEINYEGSVSLAKKSKAAGVKRFLFASSCSIYGAAGDTPRSENDMKNPLTAYALSKWRAEQSLDEIASSDFSVTALRFATACGWSPHFRADLVLNDFILTAMTENKIEVISDGTPWRPLIHVEDIGLAVAWSSQRVEAGFSAYNVGSNDWTLTIGDLAREVSELIGVDYKILNHNKADKRSYKVDFDKYYRDASGWQPSRDLESTVLEIKTKMEPHLLRYRSFKAGSLIRMNVLKQLVSQGALDARLRMVENDAG
jgi:nucleoside-diphosphate-sugar epimerase